MTGNGKVTMAVLKNEMGHLKSAQQEMKGHVKDIKDILINGNGKIAKNKLNIESTEKSLKLIWVIIIGVILALAGAFFK